MKIQKATEIPNLQSTYNFILIGDSGSGKSHSLMTFPKGWPVLILDLFGNKETYSGDQDIEVISFADLSPDQPEAWLNINSVKKQLVEKLQKDNFRWKVLVVDTVTGLSRFIENYVLMTNPKGRGIGGSAAMHHYRGMSHILGQFITSFLGFPICNVLICHVSPPSEEGKVANTAMIIGKIWRSSIYSYVHEVYHSFGKALDDKTQYVWQTQPDLHWPMLKSVLSRGGKYFGKFVEPNFSKLLFKRGLIEKDQVKEPVL